MIRGIIFDLGSTLMYFEGEWKEVFTRATAAVAAFLNERGVPVGDDFAARFLAQRQVGWKLAEETGVEQTIGDALGKTLAQSGLASPDGLLPRAVEAYFTVESAHWRAYDDALATLQQLARRGLRLGVISNADDDALVHRAVARLGFAPYVAPVLSSAAEPRWRKPDPRIFHRVSDAWRIAPSGIVMVGDAPAYDVLGAHRAGMRAIWIDRAEGKVWQKIPDALASDPAVRAEATVKALAEIPGVVGSWTVR